MSRLGDAWRALRGPLTPAGAHVAEASRGRFRADAATVAASDLIREASPRGRSSYRVDVHEALSSSAVWAALRLRANLMSALPADAFLLVNGMMAEIEAPDILRQPYPGVEWPEWMWATTHDLDRYGNTFGRITRFARDGRTPLEIEPLKVDAISAKVRGMQLLEVKENGTVIPAEQVWHERQYAPGGHCIGMSPILAGAMSIRGFLAAQGYAVDWYENEQPGGQLKNTKHETIDARQAAKVKAAWRAAIAGRDVFVTGSEWEWTPDKVEAVAAGFIEQMQWGAVETARYLDVPGDVIDAAVSGSAVTYANVVQRSLQLLVNHLGPVIVRREAKFTRRLVPPGQVVKLNSDALLRMDPETRSRLLVAEVAGRVRAPSEVRALHNLAPFTPDQIEEFAVLFPSRSSAPPSQQSRTESEAS